MKITQSTKESEAEAKVIKTIMRVAQDNSDCFDHILERFALWKAVRICSCIARFVGNLRRPFNSRIFGPLTTEEIEQQYTFWEKRVQ